MGAGKQDLCWGKSRTTVKAACCEGHGDEFGTLYIA